MRTLILSFLLLFSLAAQADEDDDFEAPPLEQVLGKDAAEKVTANTGAKVSGGECPQPKSRSCLDNDKPQTGDQIEFTIEGATFPSGASTLDIVKSRCPDLQSALSTKLKIFISSKKLTSIQVTVKGRQSKVTSSVNHAKARAETGEKLMREILTGIKDVTPTFVLEEEIWGPDWDAKTMNKDDCKFTQAQSLKIGIVANRQCSVVKDFNGSAIRINGRHSGTGTNLSSPGCNTQIGAGDYYSLEKADAEKMDGAFPPPTYTINMASAIIDFDPEKIPDRMIVAKKVGQDYVPVYDSCFVSNLYTKAAADKLKDSISTFGQKDLSELITKVVRGENTGLDPIYEWTEAPAGTVTYNNQLKKIVEPLKYPAAPLPMSYETIKPFPLKFTTMEKGKSIADNSAAFLAQKVIFCKQYLDTKTSSTDRLYKSNGKVAEFFQRYCSNILEKTFPPKLVARLLYHNQDPFKKYAISQAPVYKREREQARGLERGLLNATYPIGAEGVLERQFAQRLLNRSMVLSEAETITTKPLAAGTDGKLYVFVYGSSPVTQFKLTARCQ